MNPEFSSKERLLSQYVILQRSNQSSPLKTKTIYAFVSSRLVYIVMDSVLLSCSSIHRLQLQNMAARILADTKRRAHITPVLAALHWLPVKSRIDFKILLISYKALGDGCRGYTVYGTRDLMGHIWPHISYTHVPTYIPTSGGKSTYIFYLYYQYCGIDRNILLQVK